MKIPREGRKAGIALGAPWRAPDAGPHAAAVGGGRLVSNASPAAVRVTVSDEAGGVAQAFTAGPGRPNRAPRGPSPTARTLARLRAEGYVADVVERRLPGGCHVTKDFCGFADVLAWRPAEPGMLAVQATSDNSGNASARLRKLIALPEVADWLRMPDRRLEVWAWALRGARGERKLWTLRVIPLGLDLIEHLKDGARACAGVGA